MSSHPPSPINPFFNPSFANARQANLSSSPPSPLAPPQAPFHSDFATPIRGRPRTHSVSSLSNYVLKQPTSPLVHSSNTDQDFSSGPNPIDISTPSRSFARRPSLVPSSTLSSFQLSPISINSGNKAPNYPRQPTHASRKSLTDNWYDSSPVAPTHSRQQSRRLSVGFGPGSDLPFGSFVGSFEESILSGRMSTTPSKPLNFLAQIGVLGLGKCKPSLKCPTHVTIPFPAYFYSVGDYDSPSPYVGQIDLETALAEKKSSKGFADGGYRIPQKGQLQIVIKNPNKTAVKLFLVPYDLKDMVPGTKTFIRQKSYSADLIQEFRQANTTSVPLTPGTAKKQRDREREALRYMIHLHICSPAKGRFYLHRTIRVVFANRVPDGKEKLRNEVQQPEPKYSPWKSGRLPAASTGNSGAEESGEYATPTTTRRRRASSLMFSLAADGIAVPPHLPPPPVKLEPAAAPQEDCNREQQQPSADTVSPSRSSFGSASSGGYEKLSVYSGSSGRSELGQGLLTKKLKSLDVHGSVHPEDGDGDTPMLDGFIS